MQPFNVWLQPLNGNAPIKTIGNAPFEKPYEAAVPFGNMNATLAFLSIYSAKHAGVCWGLLGFLQASNTLGFLRVFRLRNALFVCFGDFL